MSYLTSNKKKGNDTGFGNNILSNFRREYFLLGNTCQPAGNAAAENNKT
jgi:hypothetical protein